MVFTNWKYVQKVFEYTMEFGYVQQNSIAQAFEHFYICTIMESPYFYKSNTNISFLDRLFSFLCRKLLLFRFHFNADSLSVHLCK
jgi:hypothetical protein